MLKIHPGATPALKLKKLAAICFLKSSLLALSFKKKIKNMANMGTFFLKKGLNQRGTKP